jgi:hypothetical protein
MISFLEHIGTIGHIGFSFFETYRHIGHIERKALVKTYVSYCAYVFPKKKSCVFKNIMLTKGQCPKSNYFAFFFN